MFAMTDRQGISPPPRDPRTVRIGAVSYLNSKPLIEGLAGFAPSAELVLDVPSRLADGLAAGSLDVALIPSIESFFDPDYVTVSDACVATQGPVMSVKLYSRVPPGSVRTLALDEGSRTSAALVQVLLAEKYGVQPRLSPLPLGSTMEDAKTDAVLLIGDRAMHPPRETFHTVWDLGEEWLRWTGLPFVFATWVARQGTDLGEVEPALAQARDLGLSRLREIAAREAPSLGLTEEVAYRYLSRNLHFRLGAAERSGLKLFRELAARLGLAPNDASPGMRSQSLLVANFADTLAS
jgi:chorismate dehydratase